MMSRLADKMERVGRALAMNDEEDGAEPEGGAAEHARLQKLIGVGQSKTTEVVLQKRPGASGFGIRCVPEMNCGGQHPVIVGAVQRGTPVSQRLQ